jgi:surface protein
MQDVSNNATTVLEEQQITGELTMKLKTLLHSCTVSYIDIILYYYDAEHIIKQIDIEIRKRKDFYNFIAEYGNSVVEYWQIESVDGVPYMIFDLKNLVKEVKPTIKPTSKRELAYIIQETIEKEGLNCDLNFIDVSDIEDMSWLFYFSKFNGDISKWDVSNVKDMYEMFSNSKFNGDISNWDVSNVANMSWMFDSSEFNGDISKWDVSNVKDMRCMFYESDFDGDISKWNVSNVDDMRSMFTDCPLGDNPPEWY